MAAAVSLFRERGGALPQAAPSNPLLSVEDGIGTVSIDGPILRKPDVFARVLMGATDSAEIGAALREAGQRDDIKAVFLDIDSPGGIPAQCVTDWMCYHALGRVGTLIVDVTGIAIAVLLFFGWDAIRNGAVRLALAIECAIQARRTARTRAW